MRTENIRHSASRFSCALLLAAVLFTVAVASASAQSEKRYAYLPCPHSGWYGGGLLGSEFGVATFSSFPHSGVRPGIALGGYAGYSFNSILSFEGSLTLARIAMAAQDCCIDNSYWLGDNGTLYYANVLDREGWFYEDLRSRVLMAEVALQANINLLGFFPATRDSKWSFTLFPKVAALLTQATLYEKGSGDKAFGTHGSPHWGYGGGASVGYRLTEKLHVALYGQALQLTGEDIDGMPRHEFEQHFTTEVGAKIGFALGGSMKRRVRMDAIEVQRAEELPTVASVTPELPEMTYVAKESEPVVFELLDMYFDFDNSTIRADQQYKIDGIYAYLNTHPFATVDLVGWCDRRGRKGYNLRLSLERATAIRSALVELGIDAARITISGRGIDAAERDFSKARRVTPEFFEKGGTR